MARFASAFALSCALAVVGCAGDVAAPVDPADPGSPGKSDNPTDASQIAGRFMTYGVPIADGCDMELGLALDEIEIAGTGTEFTFQMEGEEVRCVLGSEGAAECSFPENPLLAAVKTTLTGTFGDENRFDGTLTTAIECEGTECDDLAEFFEDVELPCESKSQLTALRASGDTAVEDGDFSMAVSERVGELSTCKRDVMGPLPETVEVLDSDGEFFIVDDGLSDFECFVSESGAAECERFLDVPDFDFYTYAVGSVQDDGSVVGAMAVEVDCFGSTGLCNRAAAIFGEMPCTAYHTFELAPAAQP